MIGKCKHCGADDGLHHFATNQCPVGGRESPIGQTQRWQAQTFEPVTTELDELRARVEELERKIEELTSESAIDFATRLYKIE